MSETSAVSESVVSFLTTPVVEAYGVSISISQAVAVVAILSVAELAYRFVAKRLRNSEKLDDEVKAQSIRWVHRTFLLLATFYSLSLIASKATEQFSAIWNFKLFTIADFSLEVSQLVAATIIVFVAFSVSRIVQLSLSTAKFLDGAQAYVYSRLLHYVVVVVGFFFAVSALGFDLTHMAMIASALGIGVGLGLQDIVKNFVAGIAIMLERSIKKGDYIELHGEIFGEVMEIQLRSTRLRTNDNVDVVVPNADLTNGLVTNWTLLDSYRRFKVPFGVAYGTDKELVKKAALEAAQSVEYTMKGPSSQPTVWMTGFGDSSLNFELGVWIGKGNMERPRRVLSDYLWALDDAFRKYHIEVPFPQRDINFRNSLTHDRSD